MKNIDVGTDTLNCYAANSNAQRFGGALTVHSATLLTDAASTGDEAMAAFRAQATKGKLPLMRCAASILEMYRLIHGY